MKDPCLKIMNKQTNKQKFAVSFAALNFIKQLKEFCLGIKTEFSILCGMSLIILLLFCTTYLWAIAFSALIVIGTKSILKSIDDVLCPSVSNVQPRFNSLYKHKHVHLSSTKTGFLSLIYIKELS